MQINEKDVDGLSRTYEVVIAQSELAERLQARIDEIQPQVRLKGFRPGKVPASHIRKMFGRSMMDEIIEDTVRETSQKTLDERSLKPAAFPDIKMGSDAEAVANGEADLAFEMHVEVMPDFEPMDVNGLALERPVANVSDEDVNASLEELSKSQTIYKPRAEGSKAKDGDQIVIDFIGTRDGAEFEGGSATDAEVVLGSGRFIPGFEDALVGAKSGDETEFDVTFPSDYPVGDLAGKSATFKVDVKDVREPEAAGVDEYLAKAVGFDDLKALTDAVRNNLETDFTTQSRARLKRRLLDTLDEAHSFALPHRMVEAEFEQIWRQVKEDVDRGEVAEEDKGKSEDDLKTEYRAIAERRVRLGLVLAEVGQRNKIEVANEELARAINMEARRHPGREAEVVKLFKENAQALAQLRAPIYEEKVVDFILELAEVSDVDVDRDALFADE